MRFTDNQNKTHNLEPLLQQALERSGVPGVSAAVLLDGSVTSAALGLRTTSGPSSMRAESRFGLGSMAKLLVGATLVDSIASRKLDASAPLRTYFPELAGSEIGDHAAARHLLSHTTGCYHEAEAVFHEGARVDGSWEAFLRRLAEARCLFPPGAVFNYDNSNYILSCELLRLLYGASPREVVRSRILDPLGIACGEPDTDLDEPDRYVEGHIRNPDGKFEPLQRVARSEPQESSLSLDTTMSVTDLVTVAASIIDAPIGGRGAILSPRAREMLLTPVVDVPAAPEWSTRNSAVTSYGLGCGRFGNGLLGHAGTAWGQCCSLHFDPERKLAVAVAINAAHATARDATVLAIVRSIGYASRDAASSPALPTFHQSELLGEYVGGTSALGLEVEPDGPGLVCQWVRKSGSDASASPERKALLGRFQITEEGRPVLEKEWRSLTLCFFREPGSGTPCIRAGGRSYRHI